MMRRLLKTNAHPATEACRELLREDEELGHLTIETQHCREDHETVTRF
jgi:hypothetical protein